MFFLGKKTMFYAWYMSSLDEEEMMQVQCTHVHVVSVDAVDAVTFLLSGTPILCTRPVDR